ncbi:MAG: TVP38/TMEM64 family protein [Acidobacteriaceae bacterium]|nr:TVP38/TMEM64 family protein [Acidobacteriaceae bacterium]MBV9940197.1 TVP38/TMEM64 family protein [Acidobacteriaceae bacterium]
MNEALHQVFEKFGSIGAPGFLLLFLVSSFVLIPRPLLCIFGGYLFGYRAIPLALVGGALGSALALLIARYLLRERIARMLVNSPSASAIMRAVDLEGWRLIVLLRLCSPIPGCLLNYFFGLSRIGLVSFMTASIVGVTPQVVLFVYCGIAGQILSESGLPTAIKLFLNLAGVLVTVWAVVIIRQRAKAVLAELRSV